MTKFLIITQPRSGSAWFMSCLNSHPEIYCPPYPTLFSKQNISPFKKFKPKFLQFPTHISPFYQYYSSSLMNRFTRIFLRNKSIYNFLNYMYSSHPENKISVGYKVNYSQINRYKQIRVWVNANDVIIIHLVRNNLLKRLVSHKLAKQRKLYHSSKPVESIKTYINPKILESDFKRRQSRFARYRQRFNQMFDVPFLEVSYEALLGNFDSEMTKVLAFVGVNTTVSLKSNYIKINSNLLEDIILNFDDIKKQLTGTQFETFLYS